MNKPSHYTNPTPGLLHKLVVALCVVLAISLNAISCAQAQNEPYAAQYGKPFSKVPDRRDAAIYQVNIRAFSKSGNFKGILARIDSIKALGVNVLYLMPIYPVGTVKSMNSPYCVKNYDEVNPEFGTLADLRQLVNAAHKRGMAVMLDWVANHTAFDNPWTKNKSWYLQDAGGNIISPPHTGWNDVAQLNFNSAAMRLAMVTSMKNWVFRANIDGFRCDYADGPPDSFWVQAIDTLRHIPGHRLLMLAEGKRSTLYADGFDFNFGFNFFENLKKIYKNGRSVKSIDTLNQADYAGTANGQQIVRYLTNHDVNGSDGTPLDLFDGKQGSMAAFMVVALMKGVPMIYNGQEVGTSFKLTFPFKALKIDWTVNPDVTLAYKKVIAWRNSSAAIRRGMLASYSGDDVCVFTKTYGTEKVLVVANLRRRTVTYQVPAALADSHWRNGLAGKGFTLGKKLVLEPYQYLIIKK